MSTRFGIRKVPNLVGKKCLPDSGTYFRKKKDLVENFLPELVPLTNIWLNIEKTSGYTELQNVEPSIQQLGAL